MKKSTWLQEYESEVNGKRNKSNQNKKIILIIVPIMLLLCMIPTMTNGSLPQEQRQMAIIGFAAIFVFIMFFAILMICIGKKRDVTKDTRQNVTALLRNDMEVDAFDSQMSVAPIMETTIASETSVFLTADYVGLKYMYCGDLKYRFIRRSDIVSMEYCKTASARTNPVLASYICDIKNGENKIILQSTVETGAQLEALEELLKNAQPQITVTKKNVFL